MVPRTHSSATVCRRLTWSGNTLFKYSCCEHIVKRHTLVLLGGRGSLALASVVVVKHFRVGASLCMSHLPAFHAYDYLPRNEYAEQDERKAVVDWRYGIKLEGLDVYPHVAIAHALQVERGLKRGGGGMGNQRTNDAERLSEPRTSHPSSATLQWLSRSDNKGT